MEPPAEQGGMADPRQLLDEPHDVLGIFAHHLHDLLGHMPRLQLFRRSECDQLPPVYEPQPVAVLCLVHVMGGDEDGNPLSGHVVDQVPEVPAAHRIDAGGRLIQEDDGRLMEDGASERQALLPAAGEGRCHGAAVFGKPRHPDHPLLAVLLLFRRDLVDAAEEIYVLLHRQVFVEGETLAHVADLLLDILRFADDVETGHPPLSTAGFKDAAEHADGGRFPRPVGAEKSEDLPLPDVEAHPVHRDEIAEALREVTQGDGVV